MSASALLDEAMDALMDAWGLIANAWEGNWDEAPQEWQDAARRYRDEKWHPLLDAYPASEVRQVPA